MEESILKSTKETLGLAVDYTPFDLTIITHINSALSDAQDLGVGPLGFSIEDDSANWADLQLPKQIETKLRSYVYLKVRMLFDPPSTSFLLDASRKQIEEFEGRMSIARENIAFPPTPEPLVEEEV